MILVDILIFSLIMICLLIIYLVIMLIYFKIVDIKLEKKFKEEMGELEKQRQSNNEKIKRYEYELSERERIKTKLLESLQSLSKKFNIPVSYHESLDDAAGRIVYYRNRSGRFLPDDTLIQILNSCKNSPYVLAHELGHYISLVNKDDNSEESADNEAFELCKSFLTLEEINIMEDTLKIYFDNELHKNVV